MTGYKVPKVVIVVDQIVRSPSGKPDYPWARSVAESAGAAATLVDGESPLDAELLAGHRIVGLTAGASTPEELVLATAERLAQRGYSAPEEITVAREHVHFRLPREVATA